MEPYTQQKSHAKTDTVNDVHIPTRGKFYAFFGWIFQRKLINLSQQEILKLEKQLDPFALWCHKNYYTLVVPNPVLIGLLTFYWFDGRYVLASLNASFKCNY